MSANGYDTDQERIYKLLAADIVLKTYTNAFNKIKTDFKAKELHKTKEVANVELNRNQKKPLRIDFFDKSNTKLKPKVASEDSDPDGYVRSRKYLNMKRWYCMSRPQYRYSCGISSVVSCWNYLYSTLGHGTLKPLTQEEALKIVGFTEPYDNIRFGPFTGNVMLMKWFQELNKHFSLFGEASFFYKPVGADKTFGLTGQVAKERLQILLKSKDSSFIYHCTNHYFCPIGYEREPINHSGIFYENPEEGYLEEFLDWFIIADCSRKYQQFHCIRWDDIDKDLNLKCPDFLNVRHLDRGVQQNGYKKKAEKNLHCIIHLKKLHSDPFIYSDLRLKFTDEKEDTLTDEYYD